MFRSEIWKEMVLEKGWEAVEEGHAFHNYLDVNFEGDPSNSILAISSSSSS